MKLRSELPLAWRMYAGLTALVVPVLLLIVPLNRLTRVLGRYSRHGHVPREELAADFVDNLLHTLPALWNHTCLRRSAVLFHLFRRAGSPVDLCVGVRRDAEGALAAHAWLARNGVPHLERSTEVATDFRVIARFPEVATAA